MNKMIPTRSWSSRSILISPSSPYSPTTFEVHGGSLWGDRSTFGCSTDFPLEFLEGVIVWAGAWGSTISSENVWRESKEFLVEGPFEVERMNFLVVFLWQPETCVKLSLFFSVSGNLPFLGYWGVILWRDFHVHENFENERVYARNQWYGTIPNPDTREQ